jgi:uncharacterized membrane protein
MGLMILVLGLILLLGPHVLVSLRPQRAAVVKRLGERLYKGLFAALSIAGLYFTGKGFGMYETAGPLVLWTAPAWTSYITDALMLPACIFVAATYLPGRIKLALKHPMLVAVGTWAVAHLVMSGDVGGIILFGSMLVWALHDRTTLKRRSDPGGPSIPQGGLKNDIAAVVVGTVLYLGLGFVFHPVVVGQHVFGTPAIGT